MKTENKIKPHDFLRKIYRDNWIDEEGLTVKCDVGKSAQILDRKHDVMVRLLREGSDIESKLKINLSEVPLYSLEVKFLELNGYNLGPQQKTN